MNDKKQFVIKMLVIVTQSITVRMWAFKNIKPSLLICLYPE